MSDVFYAVWNCIGHFFFNDLVVFKFFLFLKCKISIFIWLKWREENKNVIIPERIMTGGLRRAPVAVLARHLYSAEWTSAAIGHKLWNQNLHNSKQLRNVNCFIPPTPTQKIKKRSRVINYLIGMHRRGKPGIVKFRYSERAWNRPQKDREQKTIVYTTYRKKKKMKYFQSFTHTHTHTHGAF